MVLIACLFISRLIMPVSTAFAQVAPALRDSISPAHIDAWTEMGKTYCTINGFVKAKEHYDLTLAHYAQKNDMPGMGYSWLHFENNFRRQDAFIRNDAALIAIRDSQHHVQTISLIHKKLYQWVNVGFVYKPPGNTSRDIRIHLAGVTIIHPLIHHPSFLTLLIA
ncbi:hypothetical protein WJU16_20275 [Chitinophaga pollutisoli]|uniref:Tetratricopeptide repeat protein n=1 Tax=Chitinophaga pollutisoli TaxID=3133966 RepID=A0ABZ2YKN9_9BACT